MAQVIVGTIGRPHGLRGEVTVRPSTDRVADRFASGSQLQLDGRVVEVEGHSWVQGRLVVVLAGVRDRSAAEALRGGQLWAEDSADDLDDDEYADAALIGLAAIDSDGTALGKVTGVQHLPTQDCLVITNDEGEWLVPFVAELVPTVDLAAGHVVLDPIPGLLGEVPDAD